jgi:hypothetical protein
VPIYFELMQSNGVRLTEAGIRFTVLEKKPANGWGLYNSDSVAAPK